ncbi:hypothetical protein AB395_00006510 (plasmid) [Sinorhizobium fredii CCBAU 45436]|nr:hypothetical protein AB395_00006510 [Sinorhizobium fredii CCBAU 45436]
MAGNGQRSARIFEIAHGVVLVTPLASVQALSRFGAGHEAAHHV